MGVAPRDLTNAGFFSTLVKIVLMLLQWKDFNKNDLLFYSMETVLPYFYSITVCIWLVLYYCMYVHLFNKKAERFMVEKTARLSSVSFKSIYIGVAIKRYVRS